jgi:hypothetical protein
LGVDLLELVDDDEETALDPLECLEQPIDGIDPVELHSHGGAQCPQRMGAGDHDDGNQTSGVASPGHDAGAQHAGLARAARSDDGDEPLVENGRTDLLDETAAAVEVRCVLLLERTQTLEGVSERGIAILTRGRPQSRILEEHAFLQPHEVGAGLDPELVGEPTPEVLEGAQCLGLTARPCERLHEEAAGPLAEGMLGDPLPKARRDAAMGTERQPRLVQQIGGVQAQILEPADLRLGEALVADIGERRTVPQCQRIEDQGLRRGGVTLEPVLRLVDEVLEANGVDRIGLDPQLVAGRPGDDAPALGRSERLAELRDVQLDGVLRRPRRPISPNVLDEPVDRHRLVRVEHEIEQHRTLLGRAQVDGLAVDHDFERSEDAEFHHPPGTLIVTAGRSPDHGRRSDRRHGTISTGHETRSGSSVETDPRRGNDPLSRPLQPITIRSNPSVVACFASASAGSPSSTIERAATPLSTSHEVHSAAQRAACSCGIGPSEGPKSHGVTTGTWTEATDATTTSASSSDANVGIARAARLASGEPSLPSRMRAMGSSIADVTIDITTPRPRKGAGRLVLGCPRRGAGR